MGKEKSGKNVVQIVTALVVLALAIVGFVFYLNSAVKSDIDDEIIDVSSRSVPGVNMGIFQTQKLEEFHSWSSVPVEVLDTGKNNPFSR